MSAGHTIVQIREDFEKWAASHGYDTTRCVSRLGYSYRSSATHYAFEGYVANQVTLVAAPTPPAQDEPVVAMSNKTIERIALECGFKLKKQPDGSMALNPYVFEFARILLGHSNLPEPNDKLRKAAEELIHTYDFACKEDGCLASNDHVEALRAALEGK